MYFFVYFMYFVLCTLSIVHLCAIDTRLINATCLLVYHSDTYLFTRSRTEYLTK